jgi:hypothetical protein
MSCLYLNISKLSDDSTCFELEKQLKTNKQTMNKKVLIISILLSAMRLSAQTKTIAFKRHNGPKAKFSAVLGNEGAKGGPSNLGVAPEKWVRNSELKKVIYINDTTQAMVTEEVCRNEYSYQQQETETWRAGTDTVLRHPVFSANLSENEMRNILKADYYFANDMKEVKFVGFEKRKLQSEKHLKSEKDESYAKTETNSKEKKKTIDKYTWLILILSSSIGIGVIKLR